MTRFLIGLLLGAIVGITGTAAFLIAYGGGDYLVSTSPRLRQLEGALSRAEEDRDWLKSRLREATDLTQRLEGRFEALAARFDRLSAGAGDPVPQATSGATTEQGASGDAPLPDASPTPEAAAAFGDGSTADAPPRSSFDAIPTTVPAEQPSPEP